MAIDPRFALDHFSAAFHVFEESLRLFFARLSTFGARDDCLRSIRAHRLWPILFQQISAGKNIPPNTAHLQSHHPPTPSPSPPPPNHASQLLPHPLSSP